jgi:WD40 repeat protein
VWSVVDGSHLGTLEGHSYAVNAVAVGADGTVYSGSDDGTVRIWSGLDGSSIREVDWTSEVTSITIGTGNTVLIGDFNNEVSVWNGGAGPARILYTFTSWVGDVAIAQDGRLFIAIGEDHDAYEL